MLWNKLDKRGIRFVERKVALLGRGGQRIVDTFVRGQVVTFQQQTEEAFYFWDRFEQLVSGFSLEHQYVGILQGIDIVRRTRAAQKTIQIGNPPVFDRKLNNMLLTFVIDGVFAKTAGIDKGKMSAHLAFLKKELSFFNFFGCEELGAEIHLLLAEADPFLKMFMEQVEHIHSRVRCIALVEC